MLTNAGRFVIHRYPNSGLPHTVSDGGTDIVSGEFNGYGETDGEQYAIAGQDLFGYDVSERDGVGSIKRKQETIGGESHVFEYEYDAAGRQMVRRCSEFVGFESLIIVSAQMFGKLVILKQKQPIDFHTRIRAFCQKANLRNLPRFLCLLCGQIVIW